MKHQSKPVMVAVGWLVLASIAMKDAQGALLSGSGTNTACNVTAEWGWTFSPPEVAPQPPPTPGPWTVTVNTAAAGPGAVVTATVAHTPNNPPCHPGEAANGPMPLTATVARHAAGGGTFSAGMAAQVFHGSHRDASYLIAGINDLSSPANGSVKLSAIHQGSPVSVVPSFTNTLQVPLNVIVTPDYRAPGNVVTNGPSINVTVQPGPHPNLTAPLPSTLGLGVLSSMNITFSGSPVSSTEMAFLGLVDGVFSELDLDLGILLLTGGEGFVVPGLQSDTVDVFIGLDLTQWLTALTAFSPGDLFAFVDGISPLAPGFLVGTTPITLGPLGFETASPYTGNLSVRAVLDGHIVPEPGIVVLLVTGLLALARSTQKRRRSRHENRALYE